MKKYYSAGGARVAVRTGTSTLNFILTDHLGSTSVTTDSGGALSTDNRYRAWGESRYASGTLATKYTYTGQYSNVADFGLMYYGARWYDSSLSRFAQADSIIPQSQGVQAWDRYAGMNNNPVRFNDPDGHYGRDVHYQWTYDIVHAYAINAADEEGFGLNEIVEFADKMATEISSGDMAADAQNPDGTINLTHIENQPITPPVGDSKAPHWYTTPEAERDLGLAKNPFDFGIALHEYQDSFSHWQKLGRPDTAYGIWESHAQNQIDSRTGASPSIDTFDPINNSIDLSMLQGTEFYVNRFVSDMAKKY